MQKLPNHFKLPFSQGTAWIEDFLQRYTAKLPKNEALKISKRLYQTVLKTCQEVETYGLPPHLKLAHVNPNAKIGVFLKTDAKAIKAGSFIGIYTGKYELVRADAVYNTSYAYDVAPELHLRKSQLEQVLLPPNDTTPLSTSESYAVQTNALLMGNFTRFINHSSFHPNIEAVVSILPTGRIEILLFALKKIRPGEQLLSNYGGQYWKSLHVIPDEITPQTYILSDRGRVVKTQQLKKHPPSLRKLLPSLRTPCPFFPEEMDNHKIVKQLKKTVPQLPQKHKKEIDSFEEVVLEQGLPRSFLAKVIKNRWNIRLAPQAKPIPKNGFIGILSGCFFIDGSELRLKTDAVSNFLNHLPKSDKPNVYTKLYYDKETDSFYPLVLAKQAISHSQKLSISHEI